MSRRERIAGEDADLFQHAMSGEGVKPIGPSPTAAVAPRRAIPLPPPVDDEAQVVAALDALVSGEAHFDLSWSDEHVEGLAAGVDRRHLRKLRRGEFAVRAHVDLHGQTRKQARDSVERFVAQARTNGQRCVLIVHGRGHHSKDQIPVLKEALRAWLTHGRIGKQVLAFCSARPCDGGLGAVYVLLRR